MKKLLSSFFTDSEQKVILFLIFFALLGLFSSNFRASSKQVVSQAAVDSALDKDKRVIFDIKTINRQELISIPKIGEKTADLILTHRDFFTDIEDLMTIKGIGRKTFEKIKPYFIPFGKSSIARQQKEDSTLAYFEKDVEEGKIDINSAQIEELMLLKGIGESKAKAIVEYRIQHGAFNSLQDILKVKGIGAKTLSMFENQIKINF